MTTGSPSATSTGTFNELTAAASTSASASASATTSTSAPQNTSGPTQVCSPDDDYRIAADHAAIVHLGPAGDEVDHFQLGAAYDALHESRRR